MIPPSTIAAFTFAVLIAVAVCFQIALAAGRPWGTLAWGGKFPGRLPNRMRTASLAAALLLLALGTLVLARAEVTLPSLYPLARTLIWAVVTYCALGVVANSLTPSSSERIVWLPVTILLLISSLVVAFGP